jgi:hypothetical protein
VPRTEVPYAERLQQALKRQNVTVRGLARLLADREGGTLESKRRNVYKWLNEGVEPEPLRAAELAVMLQSPELALVQNDPRSSRLEALEAAFREEQASRERALRAVIVRLDDLEAALDSLEPGQARRPSDR